jgi:hypothetical protein
MTTILLLAASQAYNINRYKTKFTSVSRVGEPQLYYTDANAAVLLHTVLMVQTRTFAFHVEKRFAGGRL